MTYPYVLGGVEVLIACDDRSLRQPSATERDALDTYFAQPGHCDPAGRPYELYGEELPGVGGPAVTYPARD